MKKFVSAVVKKAASMVGTTEKPLGSNRGPLVNQFLAAIGLSGGYPWCAAFVYWCLMVVFKALSLGVPLPKSGACVVFERWAKKNNLLFDEPEDGDIFLSYGSPEGYRRASHTGFVVKAYADHSFDTVEGNTNLGGSREGIGVYNRHRKPEKKRYAFIRWHLAVKESVVAPAPKTEIKRSTGSTYKIFLGEKRALICEAPTLDGRTWVSIDRWCACLNVPWKFDHDKQVVTIQGREAPVDIRIDAKDNGLNIETAPIRQLAKFSGLNVEVNNQKHEIYITRKKAAK